MAVNTCLEFPTRVARAGTPVALRSLRSYWVTIHDQNKLRSSRLVAGEPTSTGVELRGCEEAHKNMKFRIVLEFDAESDSYSAVCPELPGCASAGVTEEGAQANIEEAIRLYLAPSELSLPASAKLAEVTLG